VIFREDATLIASATAEKPVIFREGSRRHRLSTAFAGILSASRDLRVTGDEVFFTLPSQKSTSAFGSWLPRPNTVHLTIWIALTMSIFGNSCLLLIIPEAAYHKLCPINSTLSEQYYT
jgi:hypothetical protein